MCVHVITTLWTGKYKTRINQKGAHQKSATAKEAAKVTPATYL